MDELMKKITTFIILALFSFQMNAFAANKKESNTTTKQEIKVKSINLIGGPIHSENKLQEFLLEEQAEGWVYDYHVDIDDAETGYITKLFVFKKI
jgi:hypothetical protein